MWIRVVFALFISSLVAQAKPCRDIRSVDFRNAVIRTSATDENELKGQFNSSFGSETFTFKGGVSEEFSDEAQRKEGPPEGRATIPFDSLLPLPSGPVVRFLVVAWVHLQGPGAHSFVLGFVCRNHTVQQVFQFSAEYGPDFKISPEGQLVIGQGVWGEHDLHCCPSQTRTLYYAWDAAEQRFKRVRVDGPKASATGP
jgi:hypothetical protein